MGRSSSRRRVSRRLPAALLAVLALATACDGREPAVGVVLVVVDTLRADHVSSYGYARATTPNLDRLAAEGQRYEEAWAVSPWTLPSVATILTGLPPWVHGAGRDADGQLRALAPEARTLAERLRERGFRTGAFVNVVFCAPNSGLARGFETYDHRSSDASNRGHRDAAATTDAALAWLEERQTDPFLLVVHYFDPHLTYDPPRPFDTQFEVGAEGRIPVGFGSAQQVFALREGSLTLSEAERASLVARYDGEIRSVDAQLGRLRRGLERLGRFSDSLFVVLADHGEEFWDHGSFEHGHSHHRELLQIPLIVRDPARAPAVSRARVGQLDVVPTVLDHVGVEPPPELPGRVLGSGGTPYAIAQGSLWAGPLVSIRGDEGTLIWNRSSGGRALFTSQDRAELQDRIADEPLLAARLEAALTARVGTAATRGPGFELRPAQRARLRALGYMR